MRALISIVMLVAVLWLGSLAWFLRAMPQESPSPTLRSEAIIVLTGGPNRVEQGLSRLADGAAPVLFISGVGPHVTRAQMLASHAAPGVAERIAQTGGEVVLDYVASTTQSNAQEAENFVRKRGIGSIRLVTAQYHMPRSVLEFQRAMPDVAMVADPVFPENYRREKWWQHDATRRQVFREFWKYYGAILRVNG